MSFLPSIKNEMMTSVIRVSSRKNLREPDSARLERLKIVNSEHATVSAKRKVKLREELQQIKGNYENRCFKKGKKRLKSERDARLKMEQYNSNRWLLKHNGKTTSKLTKREFKVFWAWYSSRVEINGQENEESGGIRLDRAADDFVRIGLFDNRSDACEFLKSVDTDSSGFISFMELMEALGDASNEIQVNCMRKFVASLTEKEKKKEADRKAEGRACKITKSKSYSNCMDPFDQRKPNLVLPTINERTVTIKRNNSC